jgi:DNA-binding NarL/FixJ family response regulator
LSNPSQSAKIKVVVTDDQELIRQGLAGLLSMHQDIELVGQASNGLEALTVVEDCKPDVVLMDIRMPGLDGVEATRRIVQQCPQVKVLILTTFEEDAYIVESLKAGASGYILKNLPTDDLANAIRSTQKGVAQLDPAVLARLVSRTASQTTEKEKKKADTSIFTERELEVLKLLASGRSNKEISAELHISEATVKSHITNLLSKLDLRDRTQAAIWALEHVM